VATASPSLPYTQSSCAKNSCTVCYTRYNRQCTVHSKKKSPRGIKKAKKTVLSVSRVNWIPPTTQDCRRQKIWSLNTFRAVVQFTPARQTRRRQDRLVVSGGRCELGITLSTRRLGLCSERCDQSTMLATMSMLSPFSTVIYRVAPKCCTSSNRIAISIEPLETELNGFRRNVLSSFWEIHIQRCAEKRATFWTTP